MITANKVSIYAMAVTLLVGGLFQPPEAVAEDSFRASYQREGLLEAEVEDPSLAGTVSEDSFRANYQREGLLELDVEDPGLAGADEKDSFRASYQREGLLDPDY